MPIDLVKRLEKGSLVTAQELDDNWSQIEVQVNENLFALQNKVDQEVGKGLSDVNFTSERADKLDNLNANWRGRFDTYADLIAAYPLPEQGWGAIVGETGTVWAEKNGAWVDTQSASLGDMATAEYDPQNKGVDVYDMANMDEADGAKILTADERDLIAKIEGLTEKTALGSYYTLANSNTWTTIIDHPDFLVQARSPATGNRVVLIINKTGSEVVYSWQASRDNFTEVRGDTTSQNNGTFEIVGTGEVGGKRFIRIAATKNTTAINKQADTWWFDIISHRIGTTGYRVYVKMLKA